MGVDRILNHFVLFKLVNIGSSLEFVETNICKEDLKKGGKCT